MIVSGVGYHWEEVYGGYWTFRDAGCEVRTFTVGGPPKADDFFVTLSDKYGKQIERWDGVDISLNARPRSGLTIQGGISTGRTLTDNCDLVPVYRCMAAFEDIGLVRRAFFHNGTALYEMNLGQPPRYHVVCKSTNRVEEIDASIAEELRRTIESVQEKLRARGYGEVGHIVEFFAVAPQSVRTAAPVVAVR